MDEENKDDEDEDMSNEVREWVRNQEDQDRAASDRHDLRLVRDIKKRDIRRFVKYNVKTIEFSHPKVSNSEDDFDKIDESNSELNGRNENKVEDNPIIQCGICLQNFEEGEKLKVLGCTGEQEPQGSALLADEPADKKDMSSMHMFHEVCITQWFFKKAECPMCRKTFLKDIGKSRQTREESKGDSSSEQEGDNDIVYNDSRRQNRGDAAHQTQQLREIIDVVQNL